MRKLILPILFLGAAVGSFFWYTHPTFSETKSIQIDIDQYDDALEKVDELQQIRDQLLSKYNSIDTQDLNRLNKMVPDNVDTVRLLIEIDEIAAQYGMTVRGVSFSRTVDVNQNQAAQPYQTMDVSFSISGPYEDIKSFLRDLEKNTRLVDIQDLQLSASDDGQDQYNISLQTYWINDSSQ